jgi:hypothetical protein
MQTDVLPNCWTWCDEDGTQHLVVEGTPVLMGPKTVPTFKSMCGNDIPIGVPRLGAEFSICEACNVRLVDLIAKALDG